MLSNQQDFNKYLYLSNVIGKYIHYYNQNNNLYNYKMCNLNVVRNLSEC